MREKKFRGKRLDNGEWVIGSYLDFGERCGTAQHEISCQGEKHQKYYNVDPATVGDFVILQDKNGVDIYEDDITKDDFGRTFIVKYSEHFLRLQLVPLNKKAKEYYDFEVPIFSWTYPEMLLEVIGNIHDNPELLEGEQS